MSKLERTEVKGYVSGLSPSVRVPLGVAGDTSDRDSRSSVDYEDINPNAYHVVKLKCKMTETRNVDYVGLLVILRIIPSLGHSFTVSYTMQWVTAISLLSRPIVLLLMPGARFRFPLTLTVLMSRFSGA